jgi:hypothetical protein
MRVTDSLLRQDQALSERVGLDPTQKQTPGGLPTTRVRTRIRKPRAILREVKFGGVPNWHLERKVGRWSDSRRPHAIFDLVGLWDQATEIHLQGTTWQASRLLV